MLACTAMQKLKNGEISGKGLKFVFQRFGKHKTIFIKTGFYFI